jgi:O-antigen/teichoic acid export membrane protein
LNEQLARQTGSAVFWKGVQHFGDKVIFLGRTLILARLLTPDDFGLLAISMIAVDFLLSITDFGMIPALVQRPEIDERHYDSAWTINMVRALGVSVVVFLAAPLVAGLFAEPRATQLIRAVAIRPVIQAAASIKIADLVRGLRFRSLTFLYIPEALANTIVSIALAPLLGVWALIAGALAGPATFALVSYVKAPYRPKISFDAAYSRPLVKFGQWIFLTSLVAVIGSSTVQAVISNQLGAAEVGLYFLAAKLAFIPYELSNKVVSEVAFSLYARLQSDASQARRAFRTILKGVSALLLPISALMMALAPSLVDNVLGPRWDGTADLIRLLTLVSLIDLIGDTFVPILKGMGKPSKIFIIEALQSSLLILLVWGLTSRFGVNGAALAWLPAVIISQIAGIHFMRKILPRPFAGLGVPMTVIATVSGLGAVIALGINGRVPSLAGFLTASFIAVIAMVALLWVSDRRFALGLSDDLIRVFPRITALVKVLPAGSKVQS